MQGSAKVRAARKKAQTDRLTAKENGKGNDYAEFFAKQPQQKLKAEVNDTIRKASQELKDATEAVQIAEIDGKGLLAAQEQAHVSALFLEKLEASKKPGAVISLTAVGGAT